MSGQFADLFSRQAGLYAQFRPSFPPAVFAYLAELAPGRSLAWDCATGSGQAALGLAEQFDRVIASDASREQLAHRAAHPRVSYLLATAEHPPLAASRAGLVTVAQAAHWFHLEAFYTAVRAVLRPGGVLALWCYELLRVTPAVDAAVDRLYTDITGPYWSSRRKLIEEHYQSLPFPFEEIPSPEFWIDLNWTLADLVGYLNSWSAVQTFIRERGYNPLAEVQDDLLSAWGAVDQVRPTRWPLYFRIGRT